MFLRHPPLQNGHLPREIVTYRRFHEGPFQAPVRFRLQGVC